MVELWCLLFEKSYPTETAKGQDIDYAFGQGEFLIAQEWNGQVL